MAFQDRIKEFRRIPAKDIKPHPQNPRLHSDSQKRTLRYMLKNVGVADVAVVYEDPEWGLTLIDGHMRQGEIDAQDIPAVILDVTREEAKLLLLTMDQVGSLAEIDRERVSELFGDTYDPGGDHLLAMSSLFGTIAPSKEQNPFEVEDSLTAQFNAATDAAKSEDATLDLYPLTPEMNEKYDYVVIVCQTDREFAALCEKLSVTRERSYKSTTVGTGRVKLFRDVKAILGIDA